jgi:hypothetical protein
MRPHFGYAASIANIMPITKKRKQSQFAYNPRPNNGEPLQQLNRTAFTPNRQIQATQNTKWRIMSVESEMAQTSKSL